jgi:hypothetical protein
MADEDAFKRFLSRLEHGAELRGELAAGFRDLGVTAARADALADQIAADFEQFVREFNPDIEMQKDWATQRMKSELRRLNDEDGQKSP